MIKRALPNTTQFPPSDVFQRYAVNPGNATTADIGSSISDHVAAADPHTGYVLESAVDDSPANGATTDPISSNWAYDHENEVTTKHLPDQTGNSGKYLTTNGSAASWGTVAAGGGNWDAGEVADTNNTIIGIDLGEP